MKINLNYIVILIAIIFLIFSASIMYLGEVDNCEKINNAGYNTKMEKGDCYVQLENGNWIPKRLITFELEIKGDGKK